MKSRIGEKKEWESVKENAGEIRNEILRIGNWNQTDYNDVNGEVDSRDLSVEQMLTDLGDQTKE